MMLKPLVLAVGIALATSTARAQDVPGVEVCTVEKSMVRRTSCLQSNVDFLQKLISKNASDSQQKLDVASRAIDDLKSAVAKKRIAPSSGRERKKIDTHVPTVKTPVTFGGHAVFYRERGATSQRQTR
jgi:hypothetical protein